MNGKQLAKLFHETYERLAPDYGYLTRKETKQFDENTPNGKLMIATCSEILNNPIAQQSLSGSDDKSSSPKCSHKMIYPTDGSLVQCTICGKVAGTLL